MLSIAHCGKLTAGGSAGIIGGGITIPGPGKTYDTLDPSIGTSPLSNNNLTMSNAGAAWTYRRSKLNVSSGKWYWEVTLNAMNASLAEISIGITNSSVPTSNVYGQGVGNYAYFPFAGTFYHNGVAVYTGTTAHAGDVIGVALDASNGNASYYKNGVLIYTMTNSWFSAPYYAGFAIYDPSNSLTVNFGATPFAYPVPADYNAGLYSLVAATWSPTSKGGAVTLSNVNLTAQLNAASAAGDVVKCSVGKSSGKWYWEVHIDAASGNNSNNWVEIGIVASGFVIDTGSIGDTNLGYSLNFNNNVRHGGVNYTAIPTTYAQPGNTVGLALDLDAKTLTFYVNGVVGHVFSGIAAGTWIPAVGTPYGGAGAAQATLTANFGATAFTYPVPSGFNPGLYS